MEVDLEEQSQKPRDSIVLLSPSLLISPSFMKKSNIAFLPQVTRNLPLNYSNQSQIRPPMLLSPSLSIKSNDYPSPGSKKPLISIDPTLSSDLDSFLSLNSTNDTDKKFSPFFLRVKAIKYKTKALRHDLRGIQARQIKLSSLYSESLSKIIDLDMSDVISQALCIKLSLDAMEEENEANRKIEGCEKGSSVDRVRVFVTNRLRQELYSFSAVLSSLQERIRQIRTADLRRIIYVLKGETVSDERLATMMETGESEDFFMLRSNRAPINTNIEERYSVRISTESKARHEDHLEEDVTLQMPNEKEEEEEECDYDAAIVQFKIAQSLKEVRERYASMKRMDNKLSNLREVFAQMCENIMDSQGNQIINNSVELNDIEKNYLVQLSMAEAAETVCEINNRSNNNHGNSSELAKKKKTTTTKKKKKKDKNQCKNRNKAKKMQRFCTCKWIIFFFAFLAALVIFTLTLMSKIVAEIRTVRFSWFFLR
mgnify:CR=1 FL=1